MSKKFKTVTITVTKHYSKTVVVEYPVDEELTGDALKDYLLYSDGVYAKVEDRLANRSLVIGKQTYEFQDPTNNDGGILIEK